MPQTDSYIELFVPESEHALAARERATDVGCTAVSSAAAATLAMMTSAVGARAVVEIGTGTGVSGLALLSGMAAGGVLTSIDIENEYQRLAREGFLAAGHAATAFRLINGRALEVLPRLNDASYDVVLIDGAPAEYVRYLEQALRLLRPGGIVLLHGLLADGRIADPTVRDPDTAALREAARAVQAHEHLKVAFLPVGAGLLAATVLADAS